MLNKLGLGPAMEQAIDREMRMQREIDRMREYERMERQVQEQREIERAYAAARQAALLEQYASSVGSLGVPNNLALLYDRAVGLGGDVPASVAMIAKQMAELDAVTKPQRDAMALIARENDLYGVGSAITGLHTPATVSDAVAAFTRDLERDASLYGVALAGIGDSEWRYLMSEQERIQSLIDDFTSPHEREWSVPDMPSLPSIPSLAEQVEDVTRRIVREELERITTAPTDEEEPLYGGDGVKRTPGFLADDHDE